MQRPLQNGTCSFGKWHNGEIMVLDLDNVKQNIEKVTHSIRNASWIFARL